jgi:hypothetical protein
VAYSVEKLGFANEAKIDRDIFVILCAIATIGWALGIEPGGAFIK